MRLITAAFLALGLGFGSAVPALAQSLFSPVVTVNDSVVTVFEWQQRIELLKVFNTPGDLPDLALEQLIEDRLKKAEMARYGVRLEGEGLQRAMEEFAARTSLPYDQFVAMLAQSGVAEETYRDFVSIGYGWRDYIRLRYASSVNVSEAQIDRAIATQEPSGYGLEVLLSEIILPARNAEEQARAQSDAARITQIRSESAFSAEAAEVSVVPSREQGGRMDWVPIDNYPAGLQQVLLGLATGEVTPPLPLGNAIALLQMRGLREVPAARPPVTELHYMIFTLPGASAEEATRIAARVHVCDDLYGEAYGLPPERLIVEHRAPAAIESDIALVLARLDPGESDISLMRGESRLLVTLCSRDRADMPELSRDAVRDALRSQQLSSFADGLLADLKAAAIISRP